MNRRKNEMTKYDGKVGAAEQGAPPFEYNSQCLSEDDNDSEERKVVVWERDDRRDPSMLLNHMHQLASQSLVPPLQQSWHRRPPLD